MKRETLLRNLEIIVKRIGKEDLPVQIKEIYVFGSFIRGKEKPRDLDVVIISDWDQAKRRRWEKFVDGFTRFIRECFVGKKIGQYLEVPFGELMMGEFREKLKSYGVDPLWASCYSWTEIIKYARVRDIISYKKIVRKKLLKGIKGVHIIIRSGLKNGFPLRAKNFRLAWSIDKPNIRDNLTMTKDEEIEFLRKECEHLREEARSYWEEKRVLEELYRGVCYDSDITDEDLAALVLNSIPKREVKEERIREILKHRGLLRRAFNIRSIIDNSEQASDDGKNK